MSDKPEKYQVVYIVLNNGKVGQFCGQVLVESDLDNLFIKDVKFSQPRPLPQGTNWGDLVE